MLITTIIIAIDIQSLNAEVIKNAIQNMIDNRTLLVPKPNNPANSLSNVLYITAQEIDSNPVNLSQSQ